MAEIDGRKPLFTLYGQWKDCTACELGHLRETSGNPTVHGDGVTGGIMVIGSAPSLNDQQSGYLFSDDREAKGDVFIRETIQELGLDRYVYYATALMCRACEHGREKETNNLMLDRRGRPWLRDIALRATHAAACAPRIKEEIYLVDPVIIVALGKEVGDAIGGRALSLAKNSRDVQIVEIPGAGDVASITDKKGAWLRKVRGQWVRPTVKRTVQYPLIVAADPRAFVDRYSKDERLNSPKNAFKETMTNVKDVYFKYIEEMQRAT